MKGFLLGLLWLVITVCRMTLLSIALVVVWLAEWTERTTEWIDRKRGIPIVQVGEEHD